jgi:carboxyl-terminal processing protease
MALETPSGFAPFWPKRFRSILLLRPKSCGPTAESVQELPKLGGLSMLVRHLLFASLLLTTSATAVLADDAADPKSTPDQAAPDQGEPDHDSAAEAKSAAGAKDKDDDYYELYQVFADTLDQVERNYVKPVSRRELIEAAIGGILGKLDPYSNYINRDDLGRFKSTVESQFGGIGIQITIDHDQLKILSPLVGTPAYRAGLQAGDHILEIEGKPTDGVSIEEAVKRLKGEAGTSVTLTVTHVGSSKRETVTVTRELIHVETVLGDHRRDDDSWDFMLDADKHIGYIRVTGFSRDTAQDLKRALENLKGSGLKGLVLDLRFNPGGLLTSAIEISDLFVSHGRIVSTQGRNTPERTWDAQEEGTFEGFPIAVLVNRYSASASEIVSACLQDHKRAVVIGERTWGKGSVQNVIELEGGRSALKLTTASYQRPSGKNIHRFPDAKETDEWGVMPDTNYEMRLSDSEMSDLIRHRRDRDILIVHAHKPADKPAADQDAAKPDADKPADPKATDPKNGEHAPPTFVDRQLQKAVDYLSQELARAQ